MRAAPAVAVQGTGGRLWAGLHIGLPALATAAVVAWAALSVPLLAGWALAGAVLAGGLTIFLCGRFARPRGAALQWDGQTWSADGAPGRLQLMVDAGFLMVLRLHADGGGERWLAVSAAEAGAAWPALRAAVYSRPPRATPRVLAPERVAD